MTGPGKDPSPLSEPRRSVFPANITLGVLRVLLGIWFIAAGITKLAVPAVWDVWASLLGGADFPFYSVSLWLGPGPSMAADLLLLGYESPHDLVGANPVRMVERLEEARGTRQDPCVLDVFRCAVYVAGSEEPDPELSKWWTWSRLRKRGQAPARPDASRKGRER